MNDDEIKILWKELEENFRLLFSVGGIGDENEAWDKYKKNIINKINLI